MIVVLSPDRKSVLLCRRIKQPYMGLLNFVGGHIEPNECGEDAAYRELFEETSIERHSISLHHMMDFTYYDQDCYVEVWCGRLKSEVNVHGDENPLLFADADGDFFDMKKYAGEGNMGHIMEQLRQYKDVD